MYFDFRDAMNQSTKFILKNNFLLGWFIHWLHAVGIDKDKIIVSK